jgi:hypothetical protein
MCLLLLLLFLYIISKIISISVYDIVILTRSHEQMSTKMVDHIVDKHHIDVDSEMMRKVKVI